MKFLVRNNDAKIKFFEDEIHEAKQYYKISIGQEEDYSQKEMEEINNYNKKILKAKTLEEVAKVYNAYTELLLDGSSLSVKSI